MMKRKIIVLTAVLALAGTVNAATQQQIRQAIDDGLDWLASTQTQTATEGYWSYANNGTVAATASAALAFIGEGILPGTNYIDGNGNNHGDVVGKAVNYVFNRAVVDGPGIYFNPANYDRSIYTTGIVSPVIYELGRRLGQNTVIGTGSGAINGLTYRQAMAEVMDWFEWGQNDPAHGWAYGGWGYRPNSGSSDNSTAQWGALPFLYGEVWGLGTPVSVQNGLEAWTNHVQNPMDAGVDWKDGGSGYNSNTYIVNMAKTGGMLLEFAVQDKDLLHPDVQNALYYMSSMETFDHWNQGATTWPDQWYGGNFGNPYAMWAVFKALSRYGGLTWHDNGTPGFAGDDFLVGDTSPSLIPTALPGIPIGQDWNPVPLTSAAGDWYSQYCEWLVNNQNPNGSWSGYQYWTGPMATGWYVNILNATGVPIPAPGAFLLASMGLGLTGWKLRRRKEL